MTQCVDSRNEELQLLIFFCTQLRYDDQESGLKRLRLTQLLSIIKTSVTPISNETQRVLFETVASNLFRCLPRSSSSTISVISPEDDDVVATPSAAWDHLQIVYDILLRLIIKKDVNFLRREDSDGSRIFHEGPRDEEHFINRNFILNLVALFNSDDPCERDAVKNIVHRTFYRSFMRKAMSELFLHLIYESDHRQNGIGEIIEIRGSLVAKRTLYIWNNEPLVRLMAQDIDMVFPILVEALEKNLKLHWTKNVQDLTQNVKV